MSDSKMRVKVVSMRDAHERRSHFTAVAGREAEFDFFDALTMAPEGLLYDPARAVRAHGRELTTGEVGCYASHFALWQSLVSDPIHDRYIVLEDDVIPDWSYISALGNAQLPNGIGYLRLYFKRPCMMKEVHRKFVRRDSNIVRLHGYAYGTQGYLITKSEAERFCRLFSSVERPIDNTLDRTWANGISNHAVFPFPIVERYVPSGIGQQRFEPQRSRASLGLQITEKVSFHLSRLRFRFSRA